MNQEELASITDLQEIARQIRVQVVRIAGMSDCHTGGALSSADLLAALYFRVMRVDPVNPQWDGRDYFILSKGHCVPALDAALALRGFFPTEILTTHLEPGSIITGHASRRALTSPPDRWGMGCPSGSGWLWACAWIRRTTACL